tara:strand:+ start:1876 stop:2460 length:585 start_codon:yes stop_codon:yes gene_type:complete
MTKAIGLTKFIQTQEVLNNEEVGEQLLKMAIGLNNLATISAWRLGDIRQSVRDEATFQARAGDNWVLLSGQDITGSDLETAHGIALLPDLVTKGYFFSQAQLGDNVFDLIASQNGSHDHRTVSSGPRTGTTQGGQPWLSRQPASGSGFHVRAAPDQTLWTYRSNFVGDAVDQEGFPTNLRVNFFIKINDTPTNL